MAMVRLADGTIIEATILTRLRDNFVLAKDADGELHGAELVTEEQIEKIRKGEKYR